MHYTSPADIIAKLKNPAVGLDPYLAKHRRMVNNVMEYEEELQVRGWPIDKEGGNRILEYLSEAFGLKIPLHVVYRWFYLYPFEACGVDPDDLLIEEGIDEIRDMLSHYYLNSWWPGPGEGITEDEWVTVLEKAVAFMHVER